jgi:hypothetical protein
MGEVEELRAHAERCRRLAKAMPDVETMKSLERMAADFESQAERLERGEAAPPLRQAN